MDERITKQELFMSFAVLASRRSTCSRLQVGAVISDGQLEQVLAFGYNGGPRGGRNTCARPEAGNCGCAHAEMNALVKAPRGRKMAFLTDSPCETCAVLMVNANVYQMAYLREYRDTTGLELMKDAGIHCFQMKSQLFPPDTWPHKFTASVITDMSPLPGGIHPGPGTSHTPAPLQPMFREGVAWRES